MTTSLGIFEQSGQSILANGKPRISPVFQYCAVTVLFCLVHGSAISLMSSSAAVNQVFFFSFFFIFTFFLSLLMNLSLKQSDRIVR